MKQYGLRRGSSRDVYSTLNPMTPGEVGTENEAIRPMPYGGSSNPWIVRMH